MELYNIFPEKIKRAFLEHKFIYEKIQEIRLRVNRQIFVKYDNAEKELHLGGAGVVFSQEDMRETLEYLSNYSLYAYEDEIKQGFITIRGGHRVGVAGRIVLEDDKIKIIKNISSINIRVAHEIKGAADKIMNIITENGEPKHTLIISPPGAGKTTLLRDVVRQLSNGFEGCEGMDTGLVDERSEIASCYLGIPQNDVGTRTDVLDGCPKEKGMLMLIRSMAPKVVAVDEIGSEADVNAIYYVINSGSRIIATIHGNSLKNVIEKPVMNKLIKENIFERFIILSSREKMGKIEKIYTGKDILFLLNELK